tara:strand:- start:1095 stop:1232 length:138 start_codon:yes stop_codon:yes gene_type:complete
MACFISKKRKYMDKNFLSSLFSKEKIKINDISIPLFPIGNWGFVN